MSTKLFDALFDVRLSQTEQLHFTHDLTIAIALLDLTLNEFTSSTEEKERTLRRLIEILLEQHPHFSDLLSLAKSGLKEEELSEELLTAQLSGRPN